MRRYAEDEFEPGLSVTPGDDGTLVRDYISKKYFGPDIDDEALQTAQDDAAQNRQIGNLSHAAATIGNAFGGAETDDKFYANLQQQAGQGARDILDRRKGKMEEVRFGREEKAAQKDAELSDPNSAQSRVFQNALKSAAPGMFSDEDLRGISAADKDRITSLAQLKETIAARKQSAAMIQGEKKRTADEKKNVTLREVQERANNIDANLNAIETMVGEDGTWEMFGSHNQDLDRKIDQVATDMAKLMDPDSVARPAEVDLIKRGLISPGFKNKNSTAIQIIKNFRDEMKGRVDTAYRVRGLSAPAAAPPGGGAGARPPGGAKPLSKEPAVGEIRNGYVFKGGNPKDPQAWAEVPNE